MGWPRLLLSPPFLGMTSIGGWSSCRRPIRPHNLSRSERTVLESTAQILVTRCDKLVDHIFARFFLEAAYRIAAGTVFQDTP